MQAQTTFYKYISKKSLANIFSLLFSIIDGILDAMFWQNYPFLHIKVMESGVHVIKIFTEKNSTAWSRKSPNFHQNKESTSLNPAKESQLLSQL